MTAPNPSRPSASKPSAQSIRAPRGVAISCRGWQQEGVLRMLMNSLDRDVAEGPEELLIHGSVRAARDWESFQSIVSSLRALEDDQTLTIDGGKPDGISRSDPHAPRAIIDTSNRDRAERSVSATHRDRLLFGCAAEGWAYAGSQTALPVAYETFAAAAREHFGGTLAGRLVVSGGLGGIGGAQPLAATLNGAAFLGIDVDPERIKRRVKSGYCDVMVNDVDEALRILKNAVRTREVASVGLIGNCAGLIPELARRGIVPDLVTDQTSADDPTNGYVPRGLAPMQAAQLRAQDADACRERALDSIAAHVEGLLALRKLGSIAFDFGNGLAAAAYHRGVSDASEIPNFTARYLEPLLDRGCGIVTFVALSGEAQDIARADRTLIDLFPSDERLRGWIALASKHVRYQGLPARSCWLTAEQTRRFALTLNERVANDELRGPMVIATPASFLECPAWVWRDSSGHGGHAVVLDGKRGLLA